MTEFENTSSADFNTLLDRLSVQDFDGHTDFASMTPSQRLAWLSDCARFWNAAHGE